LVVDDEPGIRTILSRVLQKAGHVVGTASNGEEAILRLREKRYDLAIVDVVMPGADYFGASRIIGKPYEPETLLDAVNALLKEGKT
jgi:DNA-binding response OmpR family regulator